MIRFEVRFFPWYGEKTFYGKILKILELKQMKNREKCLNQPSELNICGLFMMMNGNAKKSKFVM